MGVSVVTQTMSRDTGAAGLLPVRLRAICREERFNDEGCNTEMCTTFD